MKLYRLSIITLCISLLTGCSSYKNVPYIQDADIADLEESLPMYDAKIMPKDLLTITVNTTDPEAAAPFTLTVQTSAKVARTTSWTSQAALQQYLVSNEGTIDSQSRSW